VCGEEKIIKIFCIGLTRAAKAGQKTIYSHNEPNEPTKEGTLSYVLQESPFASVSTVSRGHPSLVKTLAEDLQALIPRDSLLCWKVDLTHVQAKIALTTAAKV
jgi:hypothetical protein